MSDRCPVCGSVSRVGDSRHVDGTIRRRRECLRCDHRWHTIEVPADFLPDRSKVSIDLKDIETLLNVTRRIETAKR